MSKFKDAEGDTWKLRITVGTVKKVYDDTEINISKFLDDDFALAKDVMGDALKSVAVLFSVLEEQLDKARVSESQFAERLHGDALRDAKDALWDAFLDFCPSQQKELLQALEAKTETMRDKMLKEMDLDNLDLISLKEHTKPQASAG